MQKRMPLGYITLESGRKPIYAFDDFFLNYAFSKKKNWEELRLIINILLEAYVLECPGTVLEPISDKIIVTTQYKNYMKNQHNPKEQDFEIKEVNIKRFTYIEMQHSASTAKPIEIRAIEYSVLSISKNLGHVSNQIWLLAENVDKLFHGKIFANYLLKEESSGAAYPNSSCILFVNLEKLSSEKTVAGELASFLLGKTQDIKNKEASRISNVLKKSCREFSRDEGVKENMSVKEKWQEEARLEGLKIGREEGRKEGEKEGEQQGRKKGRQEGFQLGAAKLAELIKAGLSPDEALEKVSG